MTELKRICPFCGGKMIGTNGHPICHYNPDCIIHDESVPQELLDLLADTKKKLDIAVDALKVYSSESGNWWYGYEFQGHYEDYAGEYADKALKQITESEKSELENLEMLVNNVFK